MPRVEKKTKNKGGKQGHYRCCLCTEPIAAGQEYYQWQFRHAPPTRQHVTHGYPKQSQLTQSKLSGVYAAVEAAEADIAAARKVNEIDDITAALRTCAEEVDSVRQEYEDSRSNMPDHLQDVGTGAEMQEKIDALEAFKDSLESAADEIDSLLDEFEQLEEPTKPAQSENEEENDSAQEDFEENLETYNNETARIRDEIYEAAENALQELSL